MGDTKDGLEGMDPKIVIAATEMLLDPNYDFSKVFDNENDFQVITSANATTITTDKKIDPPLDEAYTNALVVVLNKAYKIAHNSYISPGFEIVHDQSGGVGIYNNAGNSLDNKNDVIVKNMRAMKEAYKHLKVLQSKLETQMSTCVNGIKNVLERKEGEMVDKTKEIEALVNSFAEKFSSLPKEEIAQKAKALTKEIIFAQETGKDWTYPFKTPILD